MLYAGVTSGVIVLYSVSWQLIAGTSGVDALVAAMHAKEDANFRLFAYVGDVNSEAEKLQAQAHEVQKEVGRYQTAADAQEAERQAKLQVIGPPLPG
jgi:hypothetical protein